jgi:hypothetical protein
MSKKLNCALSAEAGKSRVHFCWVICVCVCRVCVCVFVGVLSAIDACVLSDRDRLYSSSTHRCVVAPLCSGSLWRRPSG